MIDFIEQTAFELGFDAVKITNANDLEDANNHFLSWREKGYAADMNYLLRDNPINAKPKKILPEATSIITLLINYYTKCPPDPGPDYGRIASYAVGTDYHIILKEKISIFQETLKKEFGENVISKGFSDAVPFLEKSFAKESGHGFTGKHTLLINKSIGSYFFICEIISNLDLKETKKEEGTCGQCTRCIDICPTKAIVSPYQLDARKCISYLTIENKKGIDFSLRKQTGSWLFGCDDCQIICPYNKYNLKETTWKEFHPEAGTGHWIRLSDILSIKSDEDFKQKFANTPLLRGKRKGLIRNACIVAGNRKSKEAYPYLEKLLNDKDTMVQEHAQWAINQYHFNHFNISE